MSREEQLFRRLRQRLTLLCTAATGVILIAMALAALAVSQSQLTAKSEAAFQREVSATLYYLRSQTVVDHTWISQTESEGGLILYTELSGRPLLYGSMDSERVRLIELARKVALQNYDFDLAYEPSSLYQAQRQDFSFRDSDGQRYRAVAARLSQEKGWVGLLVLQSLAAEEGELWVQRLAFGGFVAAALCLLALFAWYFTRRALGPIEESRKRQTEFIAAASHELRAPLAVIRTCLPAIGGTDSEKEKHFTLMAEGECDRLARLISDMLALANADSGTWSMNPAPVEPETLLLEVVEQFETPARGKRVALEVSLPEEALPCCSWDGQRITQLLSILVDNGICYTPSGGKLSLRVERAGRQISLTVSDNGPGIPDGEKERVFERFYRADSARTDREHYGLGLCIAREIAQLHEGSLAVVDAPGGGACFVALLPR